MIDRQRTAVSFRAPPSSDPYRLEIDKLKREHFDIYEINTANRQYMPFVDEGIPAGFPSPAADYVGDRIDLNEELIMNPGATYYARVRDYYLVEEELEQGDAILFDTSLSPRTGDLAMCEIYGERVLKYIQKQGRKIFLIEGGSSESIAVNADTEAKVLGIVTVIIKVRRFKKRRTKIIKRLPSKEQPMLFEKRAIQAFFEPNRNVKNQGLIDLNEELIVNPIFTFFGKVSGSHYSTTILTTGIRLSSTVLLSRNGATFPCA